MNALHLKRGASSHSAYDLKSTLGDRQETHTLAVLVDNEAGVLARVIGLFSGRGYNIESLTVAETDHEGHRSRITIVTTGTPAVIEQIKAQLSRLVPVHDVHDLTVEGPSVERELALIKVTATPARRTELIAFREVFAARIADLGPDAIVFEVTGTSDDLDAFITLVEPVEVSRAGVVAIGRGATVLARVIGLFSGRGYNIDSLTVAEVDHVQHLSRINIVTSGTEQVIEQIKALLDKLVPVHKVSDLTVEGPHVERELALVKVAGEREQMVQALRIADIMQGRLVDSTTESFVFEVTGSSDQLDAFIHLMEPLGLSEVSRAGVVAMARGPKGM